ncbi:MAG: aminotransferase class IV family protein [Cyclobacteriaceae bacterium]
MSQFIETISIADGVVQNLGYHQNRLEKTFAVFFSSPPFKLAECIKDIPSKGKHKCRVVYSETEIHVDISPYPTRQISSLKLVYDNDIAYPYKYQDRSALDQLYAQRQHCDDIIIVKDGLCTDSYFANLAFFDGAQWLTPKHPLLPGTKRQKLLDHGLIKSADITIKALDSYSKVSLINAMLDLGEVEVLVDNISL